MIINPGTGGGVLDLTGTTDQVVGFDADGKPAAVSKEELRGPAGADGAAGQDGKTAYQYAVDGGYTGTEKEFQTLIGSGPWLPLSGGTLHGPLHMNGQVIKSVGEPVEASDAASKGYMDGIVGEIGNLLDKINGEVA